MPRPAKVPTPGIEFRREAMRSVLDLLAALSCETVAHRVADAILLLSGMGATDVAGLTGTGKSAVYDLRADLFSSEDPAACGALVPIAAGRGRKGMLDDFRDEILAEIARHNYHDRQEIREFVRRSFGLDPSPSTVSTFLRENDQRKLKCGSLPGKADPEWQERFWEEVLEPLLKRARGDGATGDGGDANGDDAGDGKTEADASDGGDGRGGRKVSVLFVDASHFVMGCDYLGKVWGCRRRFVRTLPNRDRYNVLGALDYVTKKVTRICDDVKMDTSRVIALLEKVAEDYEGREVWMVMDNARYQRNKAVLKRAEELGVKILFIPPYSPNLNLIERLWHMVKSELRKRSWSDFEEFKRAIDGLVDSTTGANRERVETLIGEKVQLFVGYREVDENTLEVPPYVPKAQREVESAA